MKNWTDHEMHAFERPVDDEFPGELGGLLLLRSMPPKDIGPFRCAFEVRVLSREGRAAEGEFRVAYVAFTQPSTADLPSDLTTLRRENGICVWGHQGLREWPIYRARDDQDYPLTILWVGTTLHFHLRYHHVSLDCSSAQGVESVAHFSWAPNVISIEYFTGTPTGETTKLTASSADTPMSVVVTPVPGMRASDPTGVPTSAISGLAASSFAIVTAIATATAPSEEFKGRLTQSLRQGVQSLAHRLALEETTLGVIVKHRHIPMDPVLFGLAKKRSRYPIRQHVWAVLVPPASQPAMDEIGDLLGYTQLLLLAKQVDHGRPVEKPVWLRHRDITQLFWRHVAMGYILDGDDAWQLRDEIISRANASTKRMLLRNSLNDLFEFIGKNWLEKHARKQNRVHDRTKRPTAATIKPAHPIVAGWIHFQTDIVIKAAVANNRLIEDWAYLHQAASALKAARPMMEPATTEELRLRLRGKDHEQATFELVTGMLLSKLYGEIEFVERRDDGKEPDLKVTHMGSEFYVECSRKRTSQRRQTAERIASDVTMAIIKDATDRRESVAVQVTAADLLKHGDVKPLVQAVRQAANCKEAKHAERFTVQCRTIGPWDLVHAHADLEGLVDPDCYPTSVIGRAPIAGVEDILTNVVVVGIKQDTGRDEFKSLARTIKAKARFRPQGQLPPNAPAIIAVHLGRMSRRTVDELGRRVVSAFRDTYSAASAVCFFWEESAEMPHGMITSLRTHALPIINMNAQTPWPDGLPLPTGLQWAADIVFER